MQGGPFGDGSLADDLEGHLKRLDHNLLHGTDLDVDRFHPPRTVLLGGGQHTADQLGGDGQLVHAFLSPPEPVRCWPAEDQYTSSGIETKAPPGGSRGQALEWPDAFRLLA